MEALETEAIVLTVQEYRETSLLARVLTAERGQLGLVAKGARRPRSTYASLLQPYSRLQLRLALGRNPSGGGLATLTQADLLQRPEFAMVGGDSQALTRMSWAAVFAEVLSLTHENDPHSRELYRLTTQFLAGLDASDHPGSFSIRYFYELLATLGYLPDLAPAGGGKQSIAQAVPGDVLHIDLIDGSLRQPGEILEHNLFAISVEALESLRRVIHPPEGEAEQPAPLIRRGEGKVLARLAIALFESHLERRLCSARFLEDLVLR